MTDDGRFCTQHFNIMRIKRRNEWMEKKEWTIFNPQSDWVNVDVYAKQRTVQQNINGNPLWMRRSMGRLSVLLLLIILYYNTHIENVYYYYPGKIITMKFMWVSVRWRWATLYFIVMLCIWHGVRFRRSYTELCINSLYVYI